MTFIVDTSVWVNLTRDKTGHVAKTLQNAVAGVEIVMIAPVRFELLQGCRSDAEWKKMERRVDAFTLLDVTPALWTDAARLSFDCRRAGKTIRSSLDCIIAQMAIAYGHHLLHSDRDFLSIAAVKPLQQTMLAVSTTP
jgi:predicted nucleic acid-binding protein